YKEIHTPAFQPYELYMQMNGTVNQQEMIKTIDNAGNVLVLRPDVTIPLTQRIARHHSQLEQALRYFICLMSSVKLQTQLAVKKTFKSEQSFSAMHLLQQMLRLLHLV